MDKLFSLFSTSLGMHITKLFYAFIFLIIAGIIAKIIQAVTVFILHIINIDGISRSLGIDATLKRAELKESFSEILANISFWLALGSIIVWGIYEFRFLRAIALLRTILDYLTINVIAAVFVMSFCIIAGILLSQLISFIGAAIQLPGFRIISKITQYVVIIFGSIVSLDKLGISSSIILSKLDIVLGFFALAGAIAFGLGCKDLAASYLANFLRNSK